MNVRRGSKNLEGCAPLLYINKQFSVDIDRRPKTLRSITREARESSLRVNLSIYKLFSDGKSYTINDIGNIPADKLANIITANAYIYFRSSLSP